MAKAKPTKSADIAAPQSRRERMASFEVARKKEARRRSLILLLVCIVLAAALLAYPVFLFAKDYQARHATIADFGVAASAAGCDAVAEHPASGNQDHKPVGTKIEYDEYPPDSGAHYPEPAPFTRHFYATVDERPAVSTLVHNLEHGYTIAWYRDTISQEEKDALESISKTFPSEQYDPAAKFIAAPWSEADGTFPDGKNVVLTRWYADPSAPADTTTQKGVRQACVAVSGEAIRDFMAKYPSTSAPEPNGA